MSEIFEKRVGKPTGQDIPGHEAKRDQKISEREVRHIAKLARLRLKTLEVHSYQKDLNALLEHFETLQELNTEEVGPMSHVLEIKNKWREDKPVKPQKMDSLLSNAPIRDKGYFKVPKILKD